MARGQSGKRQVKRSPPSERRVAAPKRRRPTRRTSDGFGWSPKAKKGLKVLAQKAREHGLPYSPFGEPIVDED